MLVWEVTYKITTPMFLGGIDPNKKNNIRIPSIKGMLRFWYRAVTYKRLGSIEEVRKKEAKLFGSADTGQGAFLLRINTVVEKQVTYKTGSDQTRTGLDYLGYGLSQKNEPHFMKKTFINPGTIIKVSFHFKHNIPNNEITEEDLTDLEYAIKALGLFGGLGARSRRGFGSLTLSSFKKIIKENVNTEKSIEETEVWEAPSNTEKLIEKYQNFFKELKLALGENKQLPEYSAFSILSRCIVYKQTSTNPLELLNEIGNKVLTFRKTPEISSNDRKIAYKVANKYINNKKLTHPRRVVFGLPHNYWLPKAKENKILQITGFRDEREYRRASPLFIHVHQLDDNEYVGVLLFMPAKFLPEDVEIKMIAINPFDKKVNCVEIVSNTIKNFDDFASISDFLNQLPSNYCEEVKVSG